MSDRSRPSGARIIAVANQKGGVGKTTTAINLSASIADMGKKVLLVDLDPQGNASTGLGIDAAQRSMSTYDLIFEEAQVDEVVLSTEIEGLSIIPATTDLSSADIELYTKEKRLFLLRDALRATDLDKYGFDYIFIDCPPSLNLLTVNALVAADSVLVPLQSEFFALEGLSQLMLTIREVRETANTALRIEGVVLTMYDARNNLSRQVEADARENLGDLVYRTVIPRNVRLSEAPSFAMPVLKYDSASLGARAYINLAREVVKNSARLAA
ncbi:ParA family protein [Roseovarius sp. SCSIO 43702]|uniref:ParA family protein n=1 Tax=Roseovarius sp. SCSIO 43702 TaxID=2823043 RepID=UPI002175A286|nr:AAA family ATPase [Roseovarius sp. SCSIO 43702]